LSDGYLDQNFVLEEKGDPLPLEILLKNLNLIQRNLACDAKPVFCQSKIR